MKLDRIRVSAALAAAACMMPSVAFAEESTGGADILIPKPAEFIPALVIFLIMVLVPAGRAIYNKVKKN